MLSQEKILKKARAHAEIKALSTTPPRTGCSEANGAKAYFEAYEKVRRGKSVSGGDLPQNLRRMAWTFVTYYSDLGRDGLKGAKKAKDILEQLSKG